MEESSAIQSAETIKMVERAMDVLDILHSTHAHLGVNEIAKQCALNPSTAYRILKTLEKTGWVYQLNDGRYVSGQKIDFVTEKDNLFLALSDVAGYIMQDYTDKYGQAMNLMVREGNRCIILQQSRTKSLVNYVPPLHTYMPVYASGGGKVLLSELPDSLIALIVDSLEMVSFTQYTITDKEAFRAVLKETAGRGYAFDHKESSENGSCIAVPVRDHSGTIIASLSFSGFIGIDDPEYLLKYLPVLTEAAEKISRELFSAWKW